MSRLRFLRVSGESLRCSFCLEQTIRAVAVTGPKGVRLVQLCNRCFRLLRDEPLGHLDMDDRL